MKTKNFKNKGEVISAICDNSFYLPGSGKRIDLERSLERLSMESLKSLHLIIQIKVDDERAK